MLFLFGFESDLITEKFDNLEIISPAFMFVTETEPSSEAAMRCPPESTETVWAS